MTVLKVITMKSTFGPTLCCLPQSYGSSSSMKMGLRRRLKSLMAIMAPMVVDERTLKRRRETEE